MEKLYTADQHLFHESMLTWFPDTRPFSSVKDMNDYIVEQHNARAEKGTDVYIIGDLAVKGDDREVRKCFDAMKGSKHLIMGNHDNGLIMGLRWSTVRPWHTVKDNGRRIYLQHVPATSWPGIHNGTFHFYGHTHGKLPSHGKSIDVGVDSWGLTPVTADEAVARMMEWNPDFDNYTPERKTVIACREDNVAPDPYVLDVRNEPGYGIV
jgi:calcineurin-like phosphoesterase family protein